MISATYDGHVVGIHRPSSHTESAIAFPPIGFADYHVVQLAVNKRFTGGLAYQVAYTFSKALTENDGWFGAEGKNVADPYNPRASLSPAGYDLPHILTVTSNYWFDNFLSPPLLLKPAAADFLWMWFYDKHRV